MAAIWHIEMLGGLSAFRHEQRIERFHSQRGASLLGYLAYHLARSHPREELLNLCYPECEFAVASNRFRQLLWALRRQLEPPGIPAGSVIAAHHPYLRLRPEAVSTDVGTFVNGVRLAGLTEDPFRKLERLEEAIDAYKGELLPGFYDEWIAQERYLLADRYLAAVLDLAAIRAEMGRVPQAIEAARRAVALEPLREESHCALMRLYLLQGNRVAALRQFETLAEELHREIRSRPTEAAFRLYRQAMEERGGPSEPAPQERLHLLNAPPVSREPVSRRAPSTLPPRFTKIFGREADVEALGETLRGETRLVTLVGTGGSGKTRLALEVASRLEEEFGGGVWFVPLADLAESWMIPKAIGGALNLPLSGDAPDPIERLAQHFNDAREGAPCLLVLDNYEHLAEEGALVVRALLERCPGLRCLITSRHRLHLEGEKEWPVAPLPVLPEGKGPYSLQQVAACSSVQMFVDRAQRARPFFQVTDGNAEALATLCARLEGIPLAIELAAGWVQSLSLRQIVERLDGRFELLVSRRRDVPERHRSLRAAVAYSFALLPRDLAECCAALAIFQGGWDLEGAEAVIASGSARSVASRLRDLVERALIQPELGEEPRFRMLEMIREYGLESQSAASLEALEQRYRGFYLALARRAKEGLKGPEQRAWVRRLEAERDNFRAVLQGALDAGEIELGLEIAVSLARHWEIRDALEEGCRWLERVLARAELESLPPRLVAEAWLALGFLYGKASRPKEARAALERCLAIPDLPEEITIDATIGMGLAVMLVSEMDAACAYLERAKVRAQEAGLPHLEARAEVNLGGILIEQNRFEEALDVCQGAVERMRESEDSQRLGVALTNLANAAIRAGQFELAEQVLREERVLSWRLRDEEALQFGQLLELFLYVQMNRVEEARQTLFGLLAARVASPNPRVCVSMLEMTAHMLSLLDQPERMVSLLCCARRLRERFRYAASRDHEQRIDAALAELGEVLGPERYAEAKRRGEAVSLAQVSELLAQVLEA